MLSRIILAAVLATVVTLTCILVGAILITLKVAIAVTIGTFLKDWSGAIGALAGLWWYFSGAVWPPRP